MVYGIQVIEVHLVEPRSRKHTAELSTDDEPVSVHYGPHHHWDYRRGRELRHKIALSFTPEIIVKTPWALEMKREQDPSFTSVPTKCCLHPVIYYHFFSLWWSLGSSFSPSSQHCLQSYFLLYYAKYDSNVVSRCYVNFGAEEIHPNNTLGRGRKTTSFLILQQTSLRTFLLFHEDDRPFFFVDKI